MPQDFRSWLHGGTCAAVLALGLLAWGAITSDAQQGAATTGVVPPSGSEAPANEAPSGELRAKILQVPVSNLTPGGMSVRPDITPPGTNDPAAAQRGMTAFNAFNCVGCHMSNGGGGMGPALSNSFFIYGGEPANIYLSIVQGRPNGMPAWGAVLPQAVVWDLVAYIRKLSSEPSTGTWGKTTSAGSPATEQVPAELTVSPQPWDHTQKFSDGQKP